MSRPGPDWVKLNRLLDQALDLEPAQRSQWMDSLPPEYASLRETLRDLLFRQAGLETSEVLRRAPGFPAPHGAAPANGDLIGPYRLIRQVGRGGMSTVWLAERADGSLQRQVALKLPRVSWIDRDLADRLNRERDILAALEHPGIARLYDAGVDSAGRPYLALEYVDGMALDAYVASHTLTVRERLALFEQVARAVAYAHAHLIVHRDLKPTNVLVNNHGEVRLLDFGIARLLEPDAAAVSHNAPQAVRAFTPRYAAPEQFAGESPTVATDIYSLGVILFELLAGKSPYPKRYAAADANAPEIVCLDPMPITDAVDRQTARELRGDLAAILNKALQQRPQDRYASIGDFLDDIQRYRRHRPVRAHPDTFAYRAGKFVRRYRVAVGFGSALIAAVTAGAAISLWQANVALQERDRALRLFEQSEASNDFWNRLFTETVGNDEAVTMRELLSRGEQIAESLVDSAPLQYSLAVDAIAAMYISHGMYGKAESLLATAIERTGHLDVGNHRVQSLQCKYAMAIGSMGRVQEADQLLSEVIANAGDETDLLVYCLHRRAIVARDNNDAVNALRYIQQARTAEETLPVHSGTTAANLLSDLGYAYALNGESDLAERHYEESMKVMRGLGREKSNVALTVLNNWGVLKISCGQPAAALEHFQQAVDIATKYSPDGEPPPYLLGNRAGALWSLARFDEAMHDLELMKQRALRDGNARTFVYATAVMAELLITRGELKQAESLLGQFSVENGYVPDTTPAGLRLLLVQGRLRAGQGRYADAMSLLNRAIDGFGKGKTVVGGVARVHIVRAELQLTLGNLDEALEDARKAVEIATITRGANAYSNLLGLASIVTGEVQRARGNRSAAAEALNAAIDNLRHTVGKDHPDVARAQRLLQELSSA